MDKHSELWQRLRAARAKARMTQLQVSKRMNLSRGAIAQWEANDVGYRTQPSASQVQALAELYQVPAAYLLDDTAHADDVWGTMGRPGVAPNGTDNDAALAAAFWAAVRYGLLVRHPEAAVAFDVSYARGGLTATVAFSNGRHMVSASHLPPSVAAGDKIRAEVSALLWAEKLSGKNQGKHLLLFGSPACLGDLDVAAMTRATTVTIRCFSSVDKAVEYMAALFE